MFAVIYIPDFLLQAALRHQPDLHGQAVALVDGSEAKPTIIQLTEAAVGAGVRHGMTPTQALARCARIVIKRRGPAQETLANQAVIDCAFGFSPYVENTAPGICTIDLRGNPLLYRKQDSANFPLATSALQNWGGQILARLVELNLAAQIGIAGNPLLALYAARAAQPVRVISDPEAFLSELPIDAIEPSPQNNEILERWGIHTVGAFIALGKHAVSERLGIEGSALFDRATANSTRPLRIAQPPETFEEALDFEHEIETTQPLLFVLRRFLDQIVLRLEIVYLVAEEIDLRLIFAHGPDYQRSFKIPAATRDASTLFRILDTHLESLRTPHPVTGVRLSVKPCRPSNQQFSLFEAALRDPNQFYETLASLTGLLGSERVGVPVVEATRRADSFHVEPVNFEWVARVSTGNSKLRPSHVAGPGPSDEWSRRLGLALRRFRPPLLAQVTVAKDAPIAIKTSEFDRAIVGVEGPWRSSGDWWDARPWDQEEWDVQTTSGELYRLSHRENQWFVEALYD